MPPRIAVVQHGDYREALRIVHSGQGETYFGMTRSVEVLGRLLDDLPHLVISLDAPAYRETHGRGTLLGLPRPRLPGALPGTVGMLVWSDRVARAIETFAPTHLLIRTAGLMALQLLKLCRKKSYGTLVVFANVLSNERVASRWVNRRTIELLNEPFVFRVGNFKATATERLIADGLDPSKAVAYTWAGEKDPANFPVKALKPDRPRQVVYAGMVTADKGVPELVEAVSRLRQGGTDVRLTVAGAGDQLDALRGRAEALGLSNGAVAFLGRVSNAEVFDLALSATAACVPTRPSFQEGMPLALTEALASRTPVVASDHPVFTGTFVEGEGLRFFRSGDPDSLAAALLDVVSGPDRYAALSRSTADAYRRVACPTTFGDLIDAWAKTLR
jgi:glycosyltransferase involved in cell wall biosynthesis